jgi:hypothetical protein
MKKHIISLLVILLAGCATPTDKLKTAIYNHLATPEVIDSYLARGAELNVPSGRYGSITVLGYCVDQSSDVWGCDFETFKALLERGSDPSKIWMSEKDREWGPQHAIHELAVIGRNKEIRYLVEELSVPVDLVGYKHSGTPLTIAYKFNNMDTIRLLYELGADPSKLTLHDRPATVDDLIEYRAGIEKRSIKRNKEKQKQRQKEGGSFLTKALVIGSVVAISSTSDISLAKQMEVVGAVAADVINDTNGENTKQIYLKSQQQAESNNITDPKATMNSQLVASPKLQTKASSNKPSSSGFCRASAWGAYRTIYWDGSSLQCANGAAPVFDNNSFWMGQLCNDKQPNRDPNKIIRCQGPELESARSAAKATMPQEAWTKWGL